MYYAIVLFIILGFHPHVSAKSDRLLSVYRSTESQFSSGEILHSVLTKGLTDTQSVSWWEIETLDGKKGFVPAKKILGAEGFSKLEIKDNQSRLILTRALTRTNAKLHKLPSADAQVIKALKPGSQLDILNFGISKNPDEIWVRARVDGKEGFLDLRDALTALDLISSIALTNGETRHVKYALSGWLITQSGERYGPAEIQTADWKSQAFVVEATTLQDSTKPSSKTILQLTTGTRVHLIRPTQQIWGSSFVPRLGLMMWTDEGLTKQEPPKEKLSTEQLFERTLYDMATHPIRSNLRVASANGVFITTDGELWKPIKSFEGQNQSVSFTASGHLIVGDRISTDAGETFHPLVKWDDVTPLLKYKTGKVPSWMRIVDIQTRFEDISVEVEVGKSSVVRLQSNDLGQTWILAR